LNNARGQIEGHQEVGPKGHIPIARAGKVFAGMADTRLNPQSGQYACKK